MTKKPALSETTVSSSSSPTTVTEDTSVTVTKESTDATSSLVDKRSGRGKADFTDDKTYDKNPNRLANVRWPLGEEPYPDTPGTEKDDGWVNVKIDRVNLPLEPNQKHLLGSGPKIRLRCQVAQCGKEMHIAAAMSARKVLQDAGYTFKPKAKYKDIEKRLVIAACEAGHTIQLTEEFAERLKVHE